MQTCPAFNRGGCDSSNVSEVDLDFFPTNLHKRLTSPNYHEPSYFACQNCGTSFVEYTVNLETNMEQRISAILGTTSMKDKANNWFNFNVWVGV